ncbi:MAG: hypothetical protein ACT4P6_00260 [Gemmatimonadaceae bacterium]
MAQANTINPDDSTSNPHFSAITRFHSVMRTYNQSGLRYAFKYYDTESHGSVPLIAEYDALRFIFDGYALDLQRTLASPRTLPEHFRKVSEKLGASFSPSERLIQQLGQIALSQDTAKAIEFFQIATEVYPASFRNFDRLGYLWLAKGNTAKARLSFEQSLARNPNNSSARDQLKKLSQ